METRQPYPDGTAGVRASLTAMIRHIRKDRGNPLVRGWAIAVLQKAGIDGRDHPSVRAQAQALLDAIRSKTTYVPDVTGIEFVPSTEAVLCLSKDKCLRADDCDGLALALCSAMASVGLQVAILLQTFSVAGAQQHVLAAVQDESGNWLPCDPTLKDAPVGERAPGVAREEMFDPLDAHAAIGVAAETPEIISFGRIPHGVFRYDNKWWFHDGQQYLQHHEGQWQAHGVAALPKEVGVGPGRGCGGSCKTAVGFSGCTMCGLGAACESCFKFHSVGVGAGIWVYPSDVESEKVRVDAKWISLSADVDACLAAKKITDAEAHAYYLDRNAWDVYNSREVSYFGLPSQMEEVNQYEFAVYQWQRKFSTKCVVQAPIVEPREYKDPSLLPPIVPDATMSGIKTVAVAAAVIVGGAVLLWGGSQVVAAVKAGRGLAPSRTPKLDARRRRLQRA